MMKIIKKMRVPICKKLKNFLREETESEKNQIDNKKRKMKKSDRKNCLK